MGNKGSESGFSYVTGFLGIAVAALVFGDYSYRYGGVEALPQSQGQGPVSLPVPAGTSVESFVSVASTASSAAALQWLMLLMLCLWLFRLLFRTARKGLLKQQAAFTVVRVLLFAAIAFLVYAEFATKGRPIMAVGPLSPGSLPTRLLNIDAALWLRRLMEPSIWLIIGGVSAAGATARSWKTTGRRYGIAAACMFGYLAAQTIALLPIWSGLGQLASDIGLYVIYLLGQLSIIALIDAVGIEIADLKKLKAGEAFDEPSLQPLKKPAIVGGACFWVMLAAGLASMFFVSAADNLKVGAYYYSWFPQNWEHGYSWNALTPPVKPQLGEYASDDITTLNRHVSLAKDAGISFFIFDWWPNRPWVRGNFFRMLSTEGSLKDFKFAMHYESLDMDDPDKPSAVPDTFVTQEGENILYITSQRAERMKLHWERIAKFYMKHPSYLKVDGKPVLFVYATRHLVGPLPHAIREARAHVKEKTGHELFLVGDEAFFNVMTISPEGRIFLAPENSPNWQRLVEFDAVTSYNPYDSTRAVHAGVQGAELFLKDVERTYQWYRRYAATAGIRFIPGIIPGYNDRAVRPKKDHYVIPRSLPVGGKDASLFSESLRRFGLPFVDRELGMLTITSWNEWNEGTQIEPTQEAACTAEDSSESRDAVTQGIMHCGYGMQHLDELKQAIAEFKAN